MERETWFADVLLPLPLPGFYTYRVPYELNGSFARGCRVVVQFGKQKFYTALVYRLHQTAPQTPQVKYILSVVDERPVVNELQLQLWDWIAQYYLCRHGEVMNAALPSALKLASESRIVINPSADIALDELNEKERILTETLAWRKVLTVSEASEVTEQKKIIPLLKTLMEKGIIVLEEELQQKFKPKVEVCVRLAEKYREDEYALRELMGELDKKAPKQCDLVMYYCHLTRPGIIQPHYITRSQLVAGAKATSTQCNGLVKKGVFELYETVTSRLGQYDSSATVDSIVFSPAQQQAWEEVQRGIAAKNVTLLHGVTSSGKTELYIKLIDEMLKQKKQILFLLPEIALTTQIISRLRKYFGDKVGVYHSRYNEQERVEIWNRVLDWNPDRENEKYSIILGARSALFLPFSRLGLIIVDEEHDNSYKQVEPAPRYNARDAAIMLASFHKASVLLGSATPAIETYYNARSGKYALAELGSRYGDIPMPAIECVNIRQEARSKRMRSHFSQTLLDRIGTALQNKEQVILFQNRRGFSLHVECSVCEWTPGCKNCDVSLIYHKQNNSLRCHYCGYSIKPPDSCPECKNPTLVMHGFGTEKIEEELALFFPDSSIARMDLDTTRSKHSYQQIITDFEDRKIDILVGTQMITKGLDFENVGLAGILNADNLLNFPDFRSFERSFQLMEQVSGRAGRKNNQGKVIIQTANPEHPVIRQVVAHDYYNLYVNQIAERSRFNYPPFYRLIRITLRHRDSSQLDKAAQILAARLREIITGKVLGPEYPLVSRIKGLYLKNIILKLERGNKGKTDKEKVLPLIEMLLKQDQFRQVGISLDVDPM
jgi:primosomal protein N' (replication factor Y)